MNNNNISHIDWSFPILNFLTYSSAEWCCHGHQDYFPRICKLNVVAIFIVLHFVIVRMDVFWDTFGFIILGKGHNYGGTFV